MYDYFITLYDGFYCSICDYDNHGYFNIDEKILNISLDQCRSILYHSIKPLYYLNNNIINYLNLISEFISSCDYKGNFSNE